MRQLAAFLLLMLVLSPVSGLAEDVDTGKALYGRFCATCHGEAGQGDGPTAAIVTIQPVDLSGLSQANGGVFPAARLIRRIDGREMLIAHGSPMPMYGAFFDGAPRVPAVTDEGEMLVHKPVLEIVEYLEGLQR
jgi:mono/diheme cytochrome c family protein